VRKVLELCRKHGILGRDVLQLEGEIRRHDGGRAAAASGARGENAKLKRIVCRLALDNAALKDLLGRKW